jgi:murein L,D-transpeptidase YafK
MGTVTGALLLVLTLGGAAPAAHASDFLAQQSRQARVRAALERRGPAVERAFRRVGASWPPQGVYLKAFKLEGELELWAQRAGERGRWVLVRTFPICASSGRLGPKVVAGDGQVPEGFYRIDRFNPWSSFHLSLGLDYPNAVDRARPRAGAPGGDIFIHGDCVTIGCLPLTDGPMEDLYLAAVQARAAGQRDIAVHLFPCRFDRGACRRRLAREARVDPSLGPFWRSLRAGFEAFGAHGAPPRVVTRAGRYHVSAREPLSR